MVQSTDGNETDLEYQHPDPYIVKLINTTREHFEEDQKVPVNRPPINSDERSHTMRREESPKLRKPVPLYFWQRANRVSWR